MEQVSDFLPVVNTAASLIALTITPVFLALISKTKNITLPRAVITFILVLASITFGVMGIALLVMLLLSLRHM